MQLFTKLAAITSILSLSVALPAMAAIDIYRYTDGGYVYETTVDTESEAADYCTPAYYEGGINMVMSVDGGSYQLCPVN